MRIPTPAPPIFSSMHRVERLLFAPPPEGGRCVFFQYLGRSGVRLVGPLTGRTYVFGWPGAAVAVDPVDADAMAELPGLRRLTPR